MAKPLRLPRVTEQAVLDGLSLRLITPAEADRWNGLVTERHYLRNAQLVGEQLRYVAESQGQWLVLLGWSAAAWHLKARDAWLHWSAAQRATRRHFLAQNSRCLVLADRLQLPNLASRAMGLCCARLAADWLAVHGHPIVAVESFVDRQITYGTTYKASGWTLLGPTAGFGRQAQDFYQRHDRPKQLWVRALDPEGTAALAQPTLPPALAPFEAAPTVRCTLPASQRSSLLDRLPQIRDPRHCRGRWQPWPAILGILALAKLAGVPGAQREIADFAGRLTKPQRRQLGCRRDPQSGEYRVPGASTFFRALRAVNYLAPGRGRRELTERPPGSSEEGERDPRRPSPPGAPLAQRPAGELGRPPHPTPDRRAAPTPSPLPNWACWTPARSPAWTGTAPRKGRPSSPNCGWPPAAR